MGCRVGILAIQGDIEAHADALGRIGAEGVPVLRARDLDGLNGLILPGGESTTISKGLSRLELWDPLREFIAAGRPVLGTCAGAILLARKADNHAVRTLDLVDATAVRNAYGTQVDSFAAFVDDDGVGPFAGMRAVFIRAPRLEGLGPSVEVLARVDGLPVLARQGRVFVCTFHPELTPDSRVHQLLLEAALA